MEVYRAELVDQKREDVPRLTQGRRLEGEGCADLQRRGCAWHEVGRPQGREGRLVRRLVGRRPEKASQRTRRDRLLRAHQRQVGRQAAQSLIDRMRPVDIKSRATAPVRTAALNWPLPRASKQPSGNAQDRHLALWGTPSRGGAHDEI